MLEYLDRLDSLHLGRHGGVYEPQETKLVKAIVRSGDVVADVGAHIGYYTDILSALVGETGRVTAFEPEPENFAVLWANTRGRKNVVSVNQALADRAGLGMLSLNGENTGDNGLYPRPGLKDIPVRISTIDAWFGNMDRPLDFLKIDVQGAECRVLRGAAETIRRNSTIVVLVEYYPLGLRLAGASGQELIDLLLFNRLSVRDARRPLSDGLDHLPVYEKKKHTNLICFGPNAEVPHEL